MATIKLRDDHIRLCQALKAAGVAGSGTDAKFMIKDGLVKVNGETEYQEERSFMMETRFSATGRRSRL